MQIFLQIDLLLHHISFISAVLFWFNLMVITSAAYAIHVTAQQQRHMWPFFFCTAHSQKSPIHRIRLQLESVDGILLTTIHKARDKDTARG